MNQLLPVAKTKQTSQPVSNWAEIKADVKAMREMVKSSFGGRWKTAVALAHNQVSEDPKTFFVLNPVFAKEYFLGIDVIINPEILEKDVRVINSEACMSHPLREEQKVHRYMHITVRIQYRVAGLMMKKTMKLHGFPAFVVQHEMEHFKGQCIYDKSNELTKRVSKTRKKKKK